MATRRDKETKPAGPINARMAREGGPKDESGTPFRVRGTQQTQDKSRATATGGRGDPEAERRARSREGRDDEV